MASKPKRDHLYSEPCDTCGKPITGFWITVKGHVCDACYREGKGT